MRYNGDRLLNSGLEDVVVICRFFLSIAAISTIVSASCLAVPTGRVNFTPPLKSAKTIQVTETVWYPQDRSTGLGPFRRVGTITLCIARPDKFRVEMRLGGLAKVTDFTVSDGITMTGHSGDGPTRFQPTQRAEWPLTVMGLLNNVPGPVSAVPAVRSGRQVLLAIRVLDGMHEEYWFDPKTHLLLRSTLSGIWQGKTRKILHTEYAGWILNKPLARSVFRVPSVGTHHKS